MNSFSRYLNNLNILVKLLPDGLNDGWLEGPDEGWELGAVDTERGFHSDMSQ